MTTLNTIIEEEKKEALKEFKNMIQHDVWCPKNYIDTIVTTAMQRAYEAGAEAERERIIKDIETDPEIPIPRPYEVAWILSKLQLHEILTPLPDNK